LAQVARLEKERRTEADAAGAVGPRTAPATAPAVATSARLPRFWQHRNPLRAVAQR